RPASIFPNTLRGAVVKHLTTLNSPSLEGVTHFHHEQPPGMSDKCKWRFQERRNRINQSQSERLAKLLCGRFTVEMIDIWKLLAEWRQDVKIPLDIERATR